MGRRSPSPLFGMIIQTCAQCCCVLFSSETLVEMELISSFSMDVI